MFKAALDFDIDARIKKIAMAAVIMLAMALASQSAWAQAFSVLHSFTNGGDGAQPTAGLTIDHAGNFYGTTSIGGAGYGTVFKLSHVGSGWILNTLYTFQGGEDEGNPFARVVFGPDGALYGTASGYNQSGGLGTVFRLTPPSHPCHSISCPWTETVLYRFQGGTDGAVPYYGDLAFDAAGNIYGTTAFGGGGADCTFDNCGTVFKLTRSGGSWTESVLHRFTASETDGEVPFSGVVLDSAGNIYGTTAFGGTQNLGVVYQLTASGTETILHNFGETNDDGVTPFGGLILDRQGNLYGASGGGPGPSNGGTVYELQPNGGGWTYSTLADLPGDGAPSDSPIMDAAGNLYVTSTGGGVFKLTPSGGGWTLTDLYNVSGYPYGSAVLDANGNVYGTSMETSTSAWGNVWEITP